MVSGSISVTCVIAFAIFFGETVAKDVGCKSRTRTASVELRPGDSFSFATINNRRNRYRGNQRCTASYTLVEGCEEASVSCSTFHTRSNADCSKGDYLIGTDTATGEEVRFCNREGPEDVVVENDFSLTFVSDRRKSGEGLDCQVTCLTDAVSTTTAATTASTTTTPATTTTANVGNPCADGVCTLKTQFGSPSVNPYVIRGIFAVWWDPKFEHTADAEALGDKLSMVRADCLANLGMADPPNVGRGNYYNVYIHHNADDSYPSGWAQGQGTDMYGNPFLTFPYGLVPNGPSILHEGFHVFQYNQNSPGFEYGRLDSQWYTESSAQWYMSTYDTNRDITTFMTAGAIVANPQLALWHSFRNEAPGDPNAHDGRNGWMYGVRQYAMHTLLYFMTEVCKVDREYLTSGFYARTELTPQEYMFKNVGQDKFRACFADWAAQNIAEMAYLSREQYERGLLEITLAGTWDLYRPYVWETVDQGTANQWIEPPQELRPRGWAYNAIRVNNTMDATYTFQLQGSAAGSQGGEAFFAGRIVVQSSNADTKYIDLDMTDGLTGEGTVTVAAADYEVALVVASVPNNFAGYQNYPYKVKVTRS